MCAGVKELFSKLDTLVPVHLLDQRVDGHGADELLVMDVGPVFETNDLLVGINLVDGTMVAKSGLLLLERVSNSDPDAASTALGWETESSIRTPVASCFIENDVSGDQLQVGCGDTLTEPRGLHLANCENYNCCMRLSSDWKLTFVVGTAQTL